VAVTITGDYSVSLFSQKRKQVIYTDNFENKEKSEVAIVEHLIKSLDVKDVIFTL
jgi:hypothetical protein